MCCLAGMGLTSIFFEMNSTFNACIILYATWTDDMNVYTRYDINGSTWKKCKMGIPASQLYPWCKRRGSCPMGTTGRNEAMKQCKSHAVYFGSEEKKDN